MTAKEERNKTLVLEAITSVFQRKDSLSVERLYAAYFIHHDPDLRQGRQVFAKIVAKLPSTVSYEPGLIIIAEGDYVALHGRLHGWATHLQIVIDIFRVEDGKLAEHWTVRQNDIAVESARSKVAMFSPDEASL
ncbi:nuclear transport factor 2 family protein [Labrys okinawensis]|uniref:nuclear transport factor 2 family protein n=1 Tax=Labrys okinawensis TaxID=346911 RepID=UPI0039BCA72C